MKNSLLIFIFLIILFFGFISTGNMVTGNAVANVENVSLSFVYLLVGSIVATSILFYLNKKKSKSDISKNKILISFWFLGIVGFFLVLASIFVSMIGTIGHSNTIVFESNNLVFWSEVVLLIFVTIVTLWILYNYVSGRGVLVLVRRQ